MFCMLLVELVSSLCPRRELRTQQPACVRRRFSQLLQKRGKDGFKASKLHNSIMLSFYFCTKTKRMFVFVDVESQRPRRASFF